ncbi:hypothetical protein BKA69DRAFT_465545 [Paraphysoderma sedebokerense]|nr:hypothetical protein BKA69DRAFT_465545 [Paraphysoderma sedebokerense]
MLRGHQLPFFFLFVLLLISQTLSTAGSSPWYLKDFAVSPPLYEPGYVVLDAAGNSTHLYVLDQWFYVHLFRFSGTSVAAGYDSYSDYYDQDLIFDNWTEGKSAVDVKIALNPYNSQLYMLKYTVGTNKPFIVVYRFPSTSIVNPISRYKYSTAEYFNTRYTHPRLQIEFDSTNVYISNHNDPQRSSIAGYFIAKLTHTLTPVANITSSTLGALSITFFCHQSPIICVWTTNQSVTEYWMSNYTVRQTYNLGPSPTTLNFNPKAVESADGSFSYYLHHNVIDNRTVVLHKKDTTHTAVTNASIQLSYNVSLPPPEAYDLIMSSSGDIIAGMMTAPNPAAGVGERDIAIFRYAPNLQLQSQFILSTALQDNITKLFLPDGDGNKIVICGSTDGSLNNTLATTASRRAFVARFEYFYVSNVSTKFQNLVEPGEVINITFSNIPPGALSGIPVVQFDQQPCTNVKWTGSVLSSTIPRGSGGPFELSVQFNYLSHKPSVSFQNLSYVLPPVLLDVEPKQGPAAGYNVTLIGANIYPDDNSITVYIGSKLCIDVKHVNATTITCRTPPGTGRNNSVILSNTGIFNSSEKVDISYDPPVISQISPLTVTTNGSALVIKGYNFGPCSQSPCAFSNITVTIGSFGSCTNGIHINDTDLQCNTPEGFGANVAVYVTVNGQNSTNSTFSYRKPEIWALNPSGSASRNPTVYIDGVNFGGLSAPRVVTFQDVVTLQNYSCPEVNWVSHQRIYWYDIS